MTDSGPRGARILVVVDNDQDRQELATILGSEGYAVMAVATVPDGLQRLRETGADIVVLDIASPKNSCFDVCRQIEEVSDVPIMLISAEHDERGVVATLEHCATDYITKPIRARELVARLRAILRRTTPQSSSESVLPPEGAEVKRAIVVGPVTIHPSARRVLVNGQRVELSRRDFDLLLLLASPPGRVRTREELIDRFWPESELADTRTLDQQIRRLRAKIEPEPGHPRHVVTVRGVGFRLESPRHAGSGSIR